MHGHDVLEVGSQAAAPGDVHGVEVEAAVGDALDDGGAGREEGAELVAVQYHRQTARGAAGEQHLVSIGHPNGEEVPDDRVPDALPSEVDPSVLVEGLAGKRSTVTVANLDPVPDVEIRIHGTAAAHDAGEGDLFVHVVRRATAGAPGEPACLGAVAPRTSL